MTYSGQYIRNNIIFLWLPEHFEIHKIHKQTPPQKWVIKLQSHKQTPQLLEFREAGPATPYNNFTQVLQGMYPPETSRLSDKEHWNSF